jgi:hypothetical protein
MLATHQQCANNAMPSKTSYQVAAIPSHFQTLRHIVVDNPVGRANMTASTTEGSSGECPVCGKKVWTIPSQPLGDATCPHCGSLLWLSLSTTSLDTIRELAERGIDVELDAEGQITAISFSGNVYDDSIVEQLVALGDIETIDLRKTAFTAVGVQRLHRLLPNTCIHH